MVSVDDVIYLVCMVSCIGFGNYFRTIKDDSQRKLIGTAFGLLIVAIVSGLHAFHFFISFGACALAITKVHPSKCHLVSFVIMFGYLVFFRTTWMYGIPTVPGHANMIQMILTLKMVGVAFEKNQSYLKLKQRENEISSKSEPSTSTEAIKKDSNDSNERVEITEYDVELQSISIDELFHYAFNYIGLLIGPYYRYRTYRDYFETPFKDAVNGTKATLELLKYASLYLGLFLLCSNIWPFSYALEDEFYTERSWLYRLFYVWPTFLIFRMRMYTGMTLSECVCTNAGFGAYPNDADVANGEGPKKEYLHLKRNPEKQEYNFKTIQNVDVYNTETCWTFREGMKHWNICVQYWLAVNVYRRFPNRKYRTIVTLLISAFWHGFQPGHYFCIMGVPFYVPVEDMYHKLIRKDATGTKRKIIDVIFWIAKFFAFSYMAIAFLLVSMGNIWKYYSSIYHFGYLYYIVLLVVGMYLMKTRKRHSSAKDKAS